MEVLNARRYLAGILHNVQNFKSMTLPFFPANLAGALSSSLGLGASVASGIGSIGASTAVTALTVLAAYEQKARGWSCSI